MSNLAPIQFETARTYSRLPRIDDAPMLNAAIVESYEELAKWVPWAVTLPSVDDSAQYCEDCIAKYQQREAFNYLMFSRDGDEFIAGIGVPRLDWTVPMFEIGYWCRAARVGQGYITEGVIALSHLCFTRLEAARLELHIDPLNAKSTAVAQACGYQLESVARRSSRNNAGELCDMQIFSCLDPADLSAGTGSPASS